MAIAAPAIEVSLELVRELLIAISQSAANTLVTYQSFSGNSDCLNEAIEQNKENSEELRSELISISLAPSPDEASVLSMPMQEGY